MPLRGSVRDPETGRYHLPGSAHGKEITAARETAKRTPVESSETIIDDRMSNTPSNDGEQGPAWITAIIQQMMEDRAAMREDSAARLAAMKDDSAAQLAAIRAQNDTLLTVLTRSRTPPVQPDQPAQPAQ